MQRGPILLLVLLLGIGGFALAYKALQTEELTPEQQPQSQTPANEGAAPTAEPTPDVIGAPPTSKRAKRIQERIADMMPSPDKRDRRRVPTSEETASKLDPDQVAVTVAAGGTVMLNGVMYELGSVDEAIASKAATDLRAALTKEHDARGGDTFRDAEGRSKLTLVLRGAGAMRADDLNRLLKVCGQPPLRVQSFELDLKGN